MNTPSEEPPIREQVTRLAELEQDKSSLHEGAPHEALGTGSFVRAFRSDTNNTIASKRRGYGPSEPFGESHPQKKRRDSVSYV